MLKNVRLIPKIRFTNYKREFPKMGKDCFSKPFWFQRMWRGRLVEIFIKHYSVTFDFRKNWLLDMAGDL